MADWLCNFLASTLDPNQFGGLKGRFTAHALVSILHSWCSTLDQGGSVHTLFLDFTKAFNRVDHNKLHQTQGPWGTTLPRQMVPLLPQISVSDCTRRQPIL